MIIENGLVVGSASKYQTRNPIGRLLLNGFDHAVSNCIFSTNHSSVLEIGCGEGHVTELILATDVKKVKATDISYTLIQENSDRIKDPRVSFETQDLMYITSCEHFDLVVCCEVLEHLDDPDLAIDIFMV